MLLRLGMFAIVIICFVGPSDSDSGMLCRVESVTSLFAVFYFVLFV